MKQKTLLHLCHQIIRNSSFKIRNYELLITTMPTIAELTLLQLFV